MDAVPVPETIDHVPEEVTSVNAVVVEFTHTVAEPPVIAATVGSALTVNDLVADAEHPPLVIAYVTVTVPAVIPVTTPPLVMDAVPVPETIDHVPDAVASVNGVVVAFTHIVADPPEMFATEGSTVTVVVADEVAVAAMQPEEL